MVEILKQGVRVLSSFLPFDPKSENKKESISEDELHFQSVCHSLCGFS